MGLASVGVLGFRVGQTAVAALGEFDACKEQGVMQNEGGISGGRYGTGCWQGS